MQNYYVRDILKATAGTLLCGDPDQLVCTVTTDSNTIGEKAVFVPIIGEHVDAHRFINDAIAKGAVAVLTSEHDEMQSDIPFIRVNNTTMALQNMGKAYCAGMVMPKIGVTGSVGKTTTKEMIACALSAGYRVFKTSGNSNSQIGVPLTLLRMRGEDQIAVLEMGISMRGEMERLAGLVQLDDAVVTNIGVSHIEQLKTQDGICEEKFHIEDAITAQDGIVFLNGDDPVILRHRNTLRHQSVLFGLNEQNDYFATGIQVKNNGMEFDVNIKNKGAYHVRLNILGEHNVRNALVAIAVADRHGVGIPAAIEALGSYEGVSMRQQIYQTKGYTIIDDSYNASPDSMKAGIDVLCSVTGVARRIAVLADMLELGERTADYHREVGAYLAESAVDELLLFGELSQYIAEGAKKKDDLTIRSFKTREEISRYLSEHLCDKTAVLLKGSRGMKLNECVEFLIKNL